MLRTEDVATTVFAAARRREGYDPAEVDTFRHDVAEALTLRDTVIAGLREELAAERLHPTEPDPAAAPVDERRESSVAAARLLEIASANADQLVAGAQAEADSLLESARAEADSLLESARAESERTVATARADRERVSRELAEREEQQALELDRRRSTVLQEVADQKSALEAKVLSLRQLETEHQDRLRRHLTEQLGLLDDLSTEPVSRAD